MVKQGTQVLQEGEKISLRHKITNKLSTGRKKINPQDENYLKLAELVDNSRILFRAKSVFPFDFFPDEIIIDKDKVSIITRYFFASDSHQSLLIKNISDAAVENSLIFSSLMITDKYYADSSIKLEYLKNKDAIKARNIIQGLITCHEKDVDISGMKSSDVVPYLEEIGRATAF